MLKKIIFYTSFVSGLNRLFYFLNKKKQLILTYHNILPDYLYDNKVHLLVSYRESLFRRHIRYIKKHFKITTNIGEPGTCVITFDDGYQNNFYIAHKILKEEGIKAIFFVPVKRELLWIDKILMWISYIPYGKYELLGKSFEINSEKERMKILDKIWEILLVEEYAPNQFLYDMEKCYSFSKLNFPEAMMKLRFTPLTEEQIVEMKESGHIIGCHSVKHDILSRLNSEELNNEIDLCEKKINTLYNSLYFSYPFGNEKEVSNHVIEKVKKSKFSHGFMNIFHPDFNYNSYAIPRMMLIPEEDKIYEIDARLSGFRYFLGNFKLFPSFAEEFKK